MVKKKETEKVEKKEKKENIDMDSVKQELTEYIDKTIKKEFIAELEKSYKRTIREKNKKIIIKNMFITGLLFIIVCFVFIMNKNDYLSKDDKEYDWLVNNSYKYGFILRYPVGKEKITGYMYEEWHFRYVGEDIAAEINKLGITYDEYVASK